MSRDINDLNTTDELVDADKLVVWKAQAGATRAITAENAANYFGLSGGPYQPLDELLTAIAGLGPSTSNGDFIQATAQDTVRVRKLTVATYAALTNIAPAFRFDDMVVYVASRAADGDGGEGWWRFDAASGATANGGTVLAPDAGTGRWIRQYDTPINVLWFGTTSAAFQSACDAGTSIVAPRATYTFTASVEPGFGRYVRFENALVNSTVAGPAFLIRGNTDQVVFAGELTIDCQNTSGSSGIKIQGTSAIASVASTNTFDVVNVDNATIGVHLYSDGNQGVYYNTFKRLQVTDSTTGISIETASGGVNQRDVNANHFGMVTIQRCVDAVVVDGGWGNYFDFLEAEANTGTAIKLVDSFTFGVNGGWIEGNTVNIDIANVPAVYSVYICAAIDSDLSSTDTKFIYTASFERSIIIQNSQYATWFGRARFEERVDVGDYGIAGNDQGNAPDGLGRIRLAASADFFRADSSSNLFFMRARTGTLGWFFQTEAGSQILDLQKSRAEFDAPIVLKNSAWNTNQLRLGSYYLWVDGTGNLRIKNGVPSSDTDGTVVGTQT